ncbi:MAG: HlyC/CorC family transporter [Verrucomicrobiota bacterium]|nr:HlyC/CorC family transporter [Verrucomicrobiota bacterium]
MTNALFFLLWTFVAIVLQGLFILFEMSCISLPRIRLQYAVSRKEKRALFIDFLLQRPSRLFGTTLIGINTALLTGSECARQFYQALHCNPDWAPISQVVLVVIFAELIPLFTARRHPRQIAFLLAPLMILFARLLTPLIWAFDTLSHGLHRLMGVPRETPLFLSREEVKMAFQVEDEEELLTAQIFQCKGKEALELMTPLGKIEMIAATSTVLQVRHLLSVHYVPFLLVYHRYQHNVVGVVFARDLLRASDDKKVLDLVKSPWFVPQTTSLLALLEQFRRNNQSAAVVLGASGEAVGLLRLEDIVSWLFGEESFVPSQVLPPLHIERTLSGDMEAAAFNRQFQGDLSYFSEETLSDLILRSLEHVPIKGETVQLGSYLFTVLEPSLRGAKILSVRSLPSS